MTPRLMPLFFGVCLLWPGAIKAQNSMNKGTVEVLFTTNQVWHLKPGGLEHPVESGEHKSLFVDPGEGLHTGEGAEARFRRADGSETILYESSLLRILGENDECPQGFARLLHGVLRNLGHHDSARRFEFCTEHAFGGALGTDFEIRVENESTIISVYEGTVEVRNASGNFPAVVVGPETSVELDNVHPPRLFSFAATNEVQWWLHYPAILDPDELKLSPEEQPRLAASLSAWRRGNVRDAWGAFPKDLAGGSESARLYWAALQMAAGRIMDARAVLTNLTESPAVAGHRWMIAALRHEPSTGERTARSATEHLGLSYLLQDQHRLADALREAMQATMAAPKLGLAWARRAELEFSQGNSKAARDSLTLALTHSPDHAPAHALRGFVLAALNQLGPATSEFDLARTLDPFLTDGWLGGGLLSFRKNERTNGLAELRLAASLETNRSLLHSYLGKAFAERNDHLHAFEQFGRAQALDPKDPTPWLYSALTLYSDNRVNAAIGDLERSLVLNENRAVYRSQMKLDEDRAVRGTGLARLYQRAGLPDVSLREAARAVASDYANYSSHLFLAETYDALRDPTRFNLRYETAWFNELLLADLLAPVGAGTFSPNVSQQEYTRLFTAEGLSIASVSDYRSDGQFRQLATQSGFFGNTAWSLDVDYQHNSGVRPNNSLDRIEWYSQIKQQVTEGDTALLLVKFQDYHSGDNFQYLNSTNPINGYGYSPSFHYDEEQKPLAVVGWRHEWSPGFQTLVLAGRLENDQRFQRDGIMLPQYVTGGGKPDRYFTPTADLTNYRGQLEIYTGELNQIAQFNDEHTLVAGGRFQTGEFGTDYRLNNLDPNSILAATYPGEININRTARANFQRWSLYAYETWTPLHSLALTAGLAYDDVVFPANHRSPPLQSGETVKARVLPKAAVTWTPFTALTLRGMYAKSLGGVSLDESFRLEPVQLAGFSQAFRTLIPESIAGSVSAPGFDVAGVALDLKLPARTYLGLRGDFLRSDVDQQIGLLGFDRNSINNLGTVGSTSQQFRFKEEAATLILDKLIGEEWSLGGSYRFQTTRLDSRFAQLAGLGVDTTSQTELHDFGLRVGWNHASGWFARADVHWYLQHHESSAMPAVNPSEDTCQVNLQAGWRFPHQRGEISAGILNLMGRDYRLDPLSGLPEFARERVFFGQLKLYF